MSCWNFATLNHGMLCCALVDLATWKNIHISDQMLGPQWERWAPMPCSLLFAQKTWLAMFLLVVGPGTYRDPFQTHLFCVFKIRCNWRAI